MILFKDRKENLRNEALHYIKSSFGSKFRIPITGLSEFFENNGELQICQIKSIYRADQGEYSILHEGSLNDSEDYCMLEEASTDLLCDIADQIHTKDIEI